MLQQFQFIEKVRSPSVPMRFIFDTVMDSITHKLGGKTPEEAKQTLLGELDMIKQVGNPLRLHRRDFKREKRPSWITW